YQIGFDAIADKKYAEGKAAWETFLQKYPLDRRAASILYGFGELAEREQGERGKEGKTPDGNEPIGLFRKGGNKYPGTEDAGRAQLEIGYLLEGRVKDLEAAIEEYSKLNWSGYAPEAQKRLAELRATRLNVMVERTFRTDEPAHVRVDVRNVET